MSEIRRTDGICTQINVVKLPADNQEEVLKLMIERARFMATQPGFVSVNLHRSKDGSHVVNYVPVDESRQTQGCAPRAGVPQEMAALQ
jgi:heme-degrading monooxygenase HmoA